MLKIWQTTDGKPADHSIHLGEIGVYIYRFIVGGYGRHIPSRPGLTLVDLGICLSFLRGLSTMLGGRSIGEINASNIIYIYNHSKFTFFVPMTMWGSRSLVFSGSNACWMMSSWKILVGKLYEEHLNLEVIVCQGGRTYLLFHFYRNQPTKHSLQIPFIAPIHFVQTCSPTIAQRQWQSHGFDASRLAASSCECTGFRL